MTTTPDRATAVASPPPSWDRRRNAVLACVMVGIMATSVLSSAGVTPAIRLIGGGLAIVLVLAQWAKISNGIRWTGTLMLITGAIATIFAPEPLMVIERGLLSTVSFLSIVAAVSLLGARAESSAAVSQIGETLAQVARQGAYGPIAIISHLVASGLSLAGTAVLMSTAARALPADDDPAAQRLAFSAILRGFCCAIAWTPMMGNMALMLTIYNLTWLDVAPINLTAALSVIGAGVVYERIRRGPNTSGPLPRDLKVVFLKVLLALCTVVPFLVILGRGTGLPIAPLIVILAAPAAMLWAWGEGHVTTLSPAGLVMRDAVARFPAFSGEALLFLGAGLASSAIAGLVPASLAQSVGGLMLGSPGILLLFSVIAISGPAIIGIHPALPALIIATTLSPEATGMPAISHFAAVLTGWGLSNILGPFTVSGLMTARSAGRSAHRVTIGWNLSAVIFVTPFAALAIEVLTRVMSP